MYIALILSPDREDVTGYGTFGDHEKAEDFAIKQCSSMNNDPTEQDGWKWLVLWLNPSEHLPTIPTEAINAEVLN